jgi:hypothetical protein
MAVSPDRNTAARAMTASGRVVDAVRTVSSRFFSPPVIKGGTTASLAASMSTTKTARFSATPTRFVPLRPSCGRSRNPVAKAPKAAPKELTA